MYVLRANAISKQCFDDLCRHDGDAHTIVNISQVHFAHEKGVQLHAVDMIETESVVSRRNATLSVKLKRRMYL